MVVREALVVAPVITPVARRRVLLVLVELRGLGRARQCGRRGLAARDRHRDRVEVADANLALVTRRGVAVGLCRELGLLQFRVGRHAALAITARQVEHRQVQAVEAGQGHELEAIAHPSDLALERGDLFSGASFFFQLKLGEQL